MILLSTIKTAVDFSLKTTVGTAITTEKFVDATNRAIDIMLDLGNYSFLKRKRIVSFLDRESDYAIVENLGISDFKQVYDLRPVDDEYPGELEFKDERKFASRKSQNIQNDEYTIDEVDGREILRLLQPFNNAGSVTLDDMDSLTAKGTWAIMDDAESLELDTTRFKEGSGAVKFDIDVSNDADNKAGIDITLTTPVDISDYKNVGVFRLWLDLQRWTATQLGYLTNAELRIGSSSAAYLAITADETADGGTFANNWNRMSFNWLDGAETGTPDYENMDYMAVILNYSSSMTDVLDVAVDEIKLFMPDYWEFWYFSSYMVAPTATSTTFQERFSPTYAGTEALRLSRMYLPVVVDLILSILFPQKMKPNDPTGLTYEQHFMKGWTQMLNNGHAILPRKEDEEAQVQGNSSGRTESYLQW